MLARTVWTRLWYLLELSESARSSRWDTGGPSRELSFFEKTRNPRLIAKIKEALVLGRRGCRGQSFCPPNPFDEGSCKSWMSRCRRQSGPKLRVVARAGW